MCEEHHIQKLGRSYGWAQCSYYMNTTCKEYWRPDQMCHVKRCLFRSGRNVLLPEEQGREGFLDSSLSTFSSPRPTCVLQYSSTEMNMVQF